MAGRPAIIEPVFMNVWAGSWLMASVWSDRTTHRSSAHFEANSGQIALIDWPDSAPLLKRVLRREDVQLGSLKLSDLLTLGDRFGHRPPVEFFQAAACDRRCRDGSFRPPCRAK